MEAYCRSKGLLVNDSGVIRLPFMVKGELVIPPEISRREIESVFSQTDRDSVVVAFGSAQVLRSPVIDRSSMQYSGEYIYHVMPLITGQQLVEFDHDRLANGLYRITVSDILDFLEGVTGELLKNPGLLGQVAEIMRLTSEYPDEFLDAWHSSFVSGLNICSARQMIDRELAFSGQPGSSFLDDWVEILSDEAASHINGVAHKAYPENDRQHSGAGRVQVRAMPTRQLHITAGNAPEVPLISALRAVLTKSAAVIKLPQSAALFGILLALAAYGAVPDHPITKNLSMVYWQGGDEAIEAELFKPGAFDRIVVWGSPQAVASVQARAPFTRIVSLNPRYGISLIGREAQTSGLEEAVSLAARDVMAYDQKACCSSLVHYVEGSLPEAESYARALQKELGAWDSLMPNFVPDGKTGQIKRMKRGCYAGASWYENLNAGRFSSGVVVTNREFDILDHPMSRLVVVRPLEHLECALQYVHQFVSAAGVYPENRRLELRDRIAARGVSSVLPLGRAERYYPGMPHDGMLVLSQLVDWKNG